ncbi:hypothetical protein RHSIM_Rhsim05G0134000 [Rhododendron simsii]|uniref:GATA-type domain-containing protein n=1 Tax=Rhododendron simsii TaxID=118357 RepID=A0A834GX39_RHOSS|nr:hypothetical protein RHSIM_Rhsim05G0134000 [Rhododendron simsii]
MFFLLFYYQESLPEEMNEIKKFCCDCKTTKTPLWRAGPSGPKVLLPKCSRLLLAKSAAVWADLSVFFCWSLLSIFGTAKIRLVHGISVTRGGALAGDLYLTSRRSI